jgi:hypothetical protein
MKSFSLFCFRSFRFLAVCGSITCVGSRRTPHATSRQRAAPRRTPRSATRLAHVVGELVHQRGEAAALQHEAARHRGGLLFAQERVASAGSAWRCAMPRRTARGAAVRIARNGAAGGARACEGAFSASSSCVRRLRRRVFAIARGGAAVRPSLAQLLLRARAATLKGGRERASR